MEIDFAGSGAGAAEDANGTHCISRVAQQCGSPRGVDDELGRGCDLGVVV
jgi:hypothetical protein